MNLEIGKVQGQCRSIRVLNSIQTLLIIGVFVEAIRRRLNGAVSRDDGSLATLRETDAKSTPGVAEARFKVQVQIVSGRHDDRRIVFRRSCETRDRSAHRRVSVPYQNVVAILLEIHVLDLETRDNSEMHLATFRINPSD